MRKTERGFTLYYYDGGGIDKIVYFLTEERGVITGVAKGAKKSKNRFGGNLEPLNEVEIILYEKENRDMPIIERVNIIKENFSLFKDYDSFNYLLAITDMIIKFTPHNVKQEKLYRLFTAILSALRNGGKIEKLFSYFVIWFLRIEGMLPDFSACSNCGKEFKSFEEFYVSSDGSSILCSECKSSNSIYIPSSFKTFNLLTKTMSPIECSSIEFKEFEEIRNFLLKLLKIYGERDLKSFKYLERL